MVGLGLGRCKGFGERTDCRGIVRTRTVVCFSYAMNCLPLVAQRNATDEKAVQGN